VIGLVIAVIYGLSTDYEVFLVSRMVEARDSGTSTADAIRIGTATTGRLITAAALVLVVVAGAFVFSDLVMMKYLAFGLVTALLLDATVVRMFLVPSVMKLLGDECWWAPSSLRWVHARVGLDEMGLRDSRTPPAMPESEPQPEEVLVGVDAPAPNWPRQPHDPTHPTVEGSVRPDAEARQASTPSAASTTPMPPARSVDTDDAASMQENAGADADGDGGSPTTREGREIQSWLDELGPPPATIPGPASATNGDDPDETTAIPSRLQQDPDIP
jgi:trehalose monomycolate/heme transporter